ncbi:hypothetical protein GC173_06775 [bacterium]|nr:hypothetical protein [bacterium]
MAGRRLTSEWMGSLALVLFLLGASLFFFRGTLETSDEIQMAMTSMSLAEHGSFRWEREYQGLYFSGYGAGTPLVGIPAYLINKLLLAVLPDEVLSLAPLTNAVLFAVIGLLASLLLTGDRRWWACAVMAIASPLLPASLTFYSEPLAAAGLLAMVVAMVRPGCWWLAPLGALAAVCARPAMVPFAGLIVVWGWREKATMRALVGGALGAALGVGVAMLQNALLRGSPFVSGYQGQEFTTPIATGLYGLMLSPERGLLLFWPLVLLPFLFWGELDGDARRLVRIASACGVFSLALHGLFWTWHGGWTAGPRFMLPVVALFVAPVAACWLALDRVGPGRRGLFWVAVAWSGLMAYIYSAHSPNAWWNTLWGFHQVENQWLFLPQLSLWQAWLQGGPLAAASAALPTAWKAGQLALVAVLCGGFFYPLILPWRGRLGTDPEARHELPLSEPRIRWREALLAPSPILFVLLCVWFSSLLSLLAGPSGWKDIDAPASDPTMPWLTVEGQPGRFEGWLDYPLDSSITLAAKADALYRVFVDGRLVMEQMEPLPRHLPRVEVPLTKGLHLIRVEVLAKGPNVAPVFQLYWTWPGGGLYLAPAGGEWILPAPPADFDKAITWLHRREMLLFAAVLALLLALRLTPRRQRSSGNSTQ